MFVYVPPVNVGDALVFKSWFISAPLASLLSSRVEKDPLSVFSAEILEVAAVILVENELDAVVNELADASFRVTLVENEELAVVNEPLILVAI